jgi:hypothetical protein
VRSRGQREEVCDGSTHDGEECERRKRERSGKRSGEATDVDRSDCGWNSCGEYGEEESERARREARIRVMRDGRSDEPGGGICDKQDG